MTTFEDFKEAVIRMNDPSIAFIGSVSGTVRIPTVVFGDPRMTGTREINKFNFAQLEQSEPELIQRIMQGQNAFVFFDPNRAVRKTFIEPLKNIGKPFAIGAGAVLGLALILAFRK